MSMPHACWRFPVAAGNLGDRREGLVALRPVQRIGHALDRGETHRGFLIVEQAHRGGRSAVDDHRFALHRALQGEEGERRRLDRRRDDRRYCRPGAVGVCDLERVDDLGRRHRRAVADRRLDQLFELVAGVVGRASGTVEGVGRSKRRVDDRQSVGEVGTDAALIAFGHLRGIGSSGRAEIRGVFGEGLVEERVCLLCGEAVEVEVDVDEARAVLADRVAVDVLAGETHRGCRETHRLVGHRLTPNLGRRISDVGERHLCRTSRSPRPTNGVSTALSATLTWTMPDVSCGRCPP